MVDLIDLETNTFFFFFFLEGEENNFNIEVYIDLII